MPKSRLDILLVARGLAESRTRAQALIKAGLVYAGGQRLDKAGAEYADDAEITVRGQEHPWVSRGGMKLAHAITHFGLDVRGAVAIDVGASTGGFTDVLLAHGAAKIYAVDVGKDQLDAKLRAHPQVVVMEETNARALTAAMIMEAGNHAPKDPRTLYPSPSGGRDGWGLTHAQADHESVFATGEDTGYTSPQPNLPPEGEGTPASPPSPIFDVIVCDASFISLTKVLPAALALAKPAAQLVTLIKPQFEVGKAEADRGKGVIRDAKLHQRVCDDISAWVRAQGWRVVGITPSPITGPKGNVEFLLVAKKSM